MLDKANLNRSSLGGLSQPNNLGGPSQSRPFIAHANTAPSRYSYQPSIVSQTPQDHRSSMPSAQHRPDSFPSGSGSHVYSDHSQISRHSAGPYGDAYGRGPGSANPFGNYGPPRIAAIPTPPSSISSGSQYSRPSITHYEDLYGRQQGPGTQHYGQIPRSATLQSFSSGTGYIPSPLALPPIDSDVSAARSRAATMRLAELPNQGLTRPRPASSIHPVPSGRERRDNLLNPRMKVIEEGMLELRLSSFQRRLWTGFCLRI